MEDQFEVPVRATMPAPALRQELSDTSERAVLRFPAPARREIRRLMRTSPRITDLCDTFPGMLYALAVRHGPPSARLSALSSIEAGAPLRDAARTLGLPMWLRKLPPEAFAQLGGDIPQSAAFSRQVAHRLPRSAAESRTWLKCVRFANEACGEDFAVWAAAQPIHHNDFDPHRALAVLSAYAWFSLNRDTEAFKLIVVPWRPEIALDTAMCAAKSWFNRVRLVLQMPAGAVTDPWLKPGAAMGYTFEPLLNADQLLKEAAAMHNCADQYAERIIRDRCRLFSVRRNGVRIATLEVGQHARETGVLAINQLKIRHNMAAANEVWQATHAWMASQPNLRRTPPLTMPEAPWDLTAWWSLLSPYRNAHSGAPWLDPNASHLVFAGLDADLSDLARSSGVSSWLFT